MPDPFSSNMSPAQCKTACLEDEACEGVVTSSGQESGYCYKRRGLSLGNCVRDSKWTLHKKKEGTKRPGPLSCIWCLNKLSLGSGATSWKTHVGLDCYEGKGGTPIQPDPLSSSISLVECRSACLRDDACEGVVTRTGQNIGYCYKRTDLTLENCVRDSDWTLHEKRAGKKTVFIGKTSYIKIYQTL